MGDRVSIQFKNGETESVVLFHHWGGLGFARVAIDYATKLKEWAESEHQRIPNGSAPLDRLEPEVVMVDFIYQLATNTGGIIDGHTYKGNDYIKNGRASDSVYIVNSEYEGDNSDNGHFLIDLNKPKASYDDDRFREDDD